MKILILGKRGQVGQELQKYFHDQPNVLALDREEDGGDLTNLEAMVARIKDYQPDVIFNAAAYTAVDKAESDRELAYLVNAQAVGGR